MLTEMISVEFPPRSLIPNSEFRIPNFGHRPINPNLKFPIRYPKATKSYGPAAYPRNEIELEQTDAAPVERADDGNNQRDAIQDHHVRNLSFPKGYGGYRLD